MCDGRSSSNQSAFESLEARTLYSRINVDDFGANPRDNSDDTGAIRAAINASAEGDTIAFNSGTYRINDTLNFKSDRAYVGRGDSLLKFKLDRGEFGVSIEANASDVRVQALNFEGGGLSMGSGGVYRNINIVGNHFTSPQRGNPGYDGPAIKITNPSDHVTIRNNDFHDFEDYGVIAFGMDHAKIEHNSFRNVRQAAHLLGLKNDSSVSFNKATGLTRMMFEIQRSGNSITRNLTVEGNVAYDWKSPYRDSFFLSIVPDHSVNTRIINNYGRASIQRGGGWNPETARDGQGKRFGYGIEAGFDSGVVQGNIIGGPFANHIILSGAGGAHDPLLTRNNKLYGRPAWRDYIQTEARGQKIERNNLKEENFDRMPAVPSINAGRDGIDLITGRPKPQWEEINPEHGDFLSDIKWQSASNEVGPVELDRANGGEEDRDGAPLILDGRRYNKGLGVNANSVITYNLDGNYTLFATDVGIDDETGNQGSARFAVYVDGRKAFDSGVMTGEDTPQYTQIDVTGAKQLRLVVKEAGDGSSNDHADWAGAWLKRA